MVCFAALVLAGCATVPQATPSSSQQIVSKYVEAYNARDLEGMSALAHPDIEWLNIEESKVSSAANGKVDLMAQMGDYFSSPQVTTSTLSGFSVNGSYVAVTETAHWKTSNGETKQQAAIAVYQLTDGLIRRVWYYPAE
jgi:hypothetical protein